MIIKKDIKKAFMLSITIVIFFCVPYVKVYAVEKQNIAVKTYKSDLSHSQKDKQEKEYAKWQIIKINGVYYYKNKRVRLLLDTGKKPSLENFSYDKKGKVDLQIIRNKNNLIKKVKYLSKKKAKKIINNLGTSSYVINNRSVHKGTGADGALD